MNLKLNFYLVSRPRLLKLKDFCFTSKIYLVQLASAVGIFRREPRLSFLCSVPCVILRPRVPPLATICISAPGGAANPFQESRTGSRLKGGFDLPKSGSPGKKWKLAILWILMCDFGKMVTFSDKSVPVWYWYIKWKLLIVASQRYNTIRSTRTENKTARE